MSLVLESWKGKPEPVADMTVRRVLPRRTRRFVGPFCFLDHMGPHSFVATADGGVPPHPHIGLATVTYLFEGEVLHRDSLGTEQRIVPGEVNWMTAGSGIVHSERPPPELVGKRATLEGLQIWVGLPQALEEAAPTFQHAAVPQVTERGLSLRVVLGAWEGTRSPIELASPTVYVVAELEPDASLVLPTTHPERAVYLVDGEARIGDVVLTSTELAVLSPGVEGRLVASRRTRVAFLAGEPLDGPRYMMWNFVSSRRERLDQAWKDWHAGRFPSVPGDVSPAPVAGSGTREPA